ncbi:MAG: type I 3-dehydroquinate dehydratase [Spirochaetes bacterium]|nr:type I 3-dehydroquinate dehydratase [Spirochaetota bacterium]
MPAPAKVCLCLTSDSIAGNLAVLERYRAEVDIAELSADRLSPGELMAAARLPALAGLPVILTVRRERDGGRWTRDERERASVIWRLTGGPAGGGFAFVELEEDLALQLAGVPVIRSLRDVHGVPEDLEHHLRGLARGTGELPKAVVAVRGTADLVRLLGVFGRTRSLSKVLVGTGDAGFATQVLASRLGSAVCYVSPAGTASAPVPADPGTLRGMYRFPAIDADTPVFGVIGDPVMHSLSPVIHNRGMAALGIPGVYLPFPVDDVPAFMAAADLLGIRGLSVTVPHKEAVITFLATRDPIVDRIGACNTLVRPEAGTGWHGTNTDAEGFLAPLRRALAGRHLAGMKAAVIGAGGASRAVVAALSDEDADVLVLNRTPDRARELAARFGTRWAGLDGRGIAALGGHADLVVQTSSAGMGEGGGDPVPGYRFSGREVVYDLVYAPRETPLLARARSAGCTVIPGIRMLLSQALGQFRLFTGRDFPAATLEELDRDL